MDRHETRTLVADLQEDMTRTRAEVEAMTTQFEALLERLGSVLPQLPIASTDTDQVNEQRRLSAPAERRSAAAFTPFGRYSSGAQPPWNASTIVTEPKPLFTSPRLRNLGRVLPSAADEATSGPTIPGQEDGVNGRASLKPPAHYKATMRFEDWWCQFSAYLAAVAPRNITDEVAANYLLGALSPAVFSALRGCGLRDEDLLNPRAIYERLESRYGDRVSPALYAQEFPQLRQAAKEDPPAFADRVRQIAHRAYPTRREEDADFRHLVIGQLLVGLRSAEIKRMIQAELRAFGETEPPTLEQLYVMVRRIEDAELRATGKQTLFGSNARVEPVDEADGATSLLTETAPSEVANSSNTLAQCQFCKKYGHKADVCRSLSRRRQSDARNQTGSEVANEKADSKDGRWTIICYRCQRSGHIRRNCHATTDKDGKPLDPCPPAPDTTSQPKSSTSPSTASHLNMTGGVCPSEPAALTPAKRW